MNIMLIVAIVALIGFILFDKRTYLLQLFKGSKPAINRRRTPATSPNIDIRALDFSSAHEVGPEGQIGLVIKLGQEPETVRGLGGDIKEHFPLFLGTSKSSKGHQTQMMGLEQIFVPLPHDIATALNKRFLGKKGSTPFDLYAATLNPFLTYAYYFIQMSGTSAWGKTYKDGKAVNVPKFMAGLLTYMSKQVRVQVSDWQDRVNSDQDPDVNRQMFTIWKQAQKRVEEMLTRDYTEFDQGQILEAVIPQLFEAILGQHAVVTGKSAFPAPVMPGGHATQMATTLSPHTGQTPESDEGERATKKGRRPGGPTRPVNRTAIMGTISRNDKDGGGDNPF